MDWYREFIAVPCRLGRYSMPLGLQIYGKQAFFKVYKETGLSRILEHDKPMALLLLYPNDPRCFYESLKHILEKRRLEPGECPLMDIDGDYRVCLSPLRVFGGTDYDIYSCTLSHGFLAGDWYSNIGYSRVYGCLLELLVYYTKVMSGIGDLPGHGYLEGLKWCIVRASNRDKAVMDVVDEILSAIYDAMRETKEG
ncbi:MAG: hypothetical protein GSR72_01000 [Desulfurococcales archaeon]|nr:hypothetical protein [Desulfurococcales archaeon]